VNVIRRYRSRPARVGLAAAQVSVCLVAVFPVYWMVLTSFKRGVDVQSRTPAFFPRVATLDNYRKVFERDYFWTSARNSLVVTLIVVGAALAVAFLAAVAVARFRFRGRTSFIVAILVILKIGMDLGFHLAEHRKKAAPNPAA